MKTFQVELPNIFAEHLNSLETLEAHRAVLNGGSRDGSYELEDDKIIHVTYRSAYGDSVDEFRRPLVGLDTWVVWSSSKPRGFHYVTGLGAMFLAESVPNELLADLLPVIAVPGPPKVRERVHSTDETLW